MRRRFNYTGRQRIKQKHVTISISEDSDHLHKFYADMDLSDYSLPEDSKIWVEAYDRNAIMRFPFGIAESPAAETETTLTSFQGNDSYYFRVKVVDTEHQSRLIASADGISPLRYDDEDKRKSLLRVVTRDLGFVPWKLEFYENDYPLLVINNNIDAGVSLARSNNYFQALVFPTILHQILSKILIEDAYRPSKEYDNDDVWKEGWIHFAGSLPGNSPFDDSENKSDDEIGNWIEDSVEMFCKHLNAVRKIRVELKEIQ